MSSDRWALMKPRAITVDGDRIVYRTAGKGPVLLLVHGMAGSSLTWRHVMPALARRFTVLAPDLLGQGQSDKPRGESYSAHMPTPSAICWTRSACPCGQRRAAPEPQRTAD